MRAPTPEHCVTCSDEAVEADVLAVDGLTADVLASDARERVAIDLVPDVEPGDVLLCHAGIALDVVRARRPAEAGHRTR